MRNKSLLVVVFVLVLTGASTLIYGYEDRHFDAEFEVGPVWQSLNDVQIPNTDQGTRFSLVDLVGEGPVLSGRIYFTYRFNPKHSLRVLVAPLSYTETGVSQKTIDFTGETFASGVPLEAIYKFNSWRVTYRYGFHRSRRWLLHIGFTAKVRDAKIEVRHGNTSANKTDLGFVPLLHFEADYSFAPSWHLALDLDALAGGPGRAEDLAIKFGYDLTDSWRVSTGYRTLEGGADVEEVYSFAWLHYALVSASFRF